MQSFCDEIYENDIYSRNGQYQTENNIPNDGDIGVEDVEDMVEDNEDNEDIHETDINKINEKKRKYINRSKESNERRNQRRRVNPFPRVLKRDVRRNYMNMYANVMNSCDKDLLSKYLNQYYSPDCMFTKATCISEDSVPSTIYQATGRNVIRDFLSLCMENSPDLLLELSNTQLRVNNKTNQTLIVSKYKVKGTKIKNTKSDFVSLMKRLIQLRDDLLFRKDHSRLLTPSSSPSLDTLYSSAQTPLTAQPTTSFKSTEIVDLSVDTFFDQRVQELDSNSLSISKQLNSILQSYTSNNSDSTKDIIKDLEQNSLLQHLSMSQSSDETLNYQMKIDLDGVMSMQLDENFLITQLETRLGKMSLEASFIYE